MIESAESLADLLKSAAHPARVQILASAVSSESTLPELMRDTNLSKTALLNHVAMLSAAVLIERVSRGTYRTTVDGRVSLLAAAANVHRGSVKRTREEREAIQRSYATAFEGEKMVERNELKKVEYVSCWLSYLGAMAGCLRYLGVRCGIREVGGYSGYSFLINVAKGETCHPSDNIGSVLAASEYAKQNGRTLLTALAVAYQVQCRLSEVAPVRAKGFDHTTQGSYAVAAGVSKGSHAFLPEFHDGTLQAYRRGYRCACG